MNKIKGLFITKFAAIVLFVISIIGAVSFGFLAIAGYDRGWYSGYEIIDYEFIDINERNSLIAFHNRYESGNTNDMARLGFRYGIIKADSLEDVDLTSKNIYLQHNFQGETDTDNLFIHQMVEYENSETYLGFSGYYKDYMSYAKGENGSLLSEQLIIGENLTSWIGLYADRICYDTAKGIFYYRAEGDYYPIQNVTISYYNEYRANDYNYGYDFEKKSYKLNYVRPLEYYATDTEIIQETVGEGVGTDISGTAEEGVFLDDIETILEGDGFGSIVSFTDLNNTRFNTTSWGELLFDGIRYLDSSELMLINSDKLPKSSFIDEPGYYLNEDFTLMVQKEVSSDIYWVVSVIPDKSSEIYAGLTSQLLPNLILKHADVKQAWNTNEYLRVALLVNIYLWLGEAIYIFLIIFIILAICMLVFLVKTAGHRKNTDEIRMTWFEKLPFEIWFFIIMIIESIILFVMSEVLHINSRNIFSGMFFIIIVLQAVLGLWAIMSLSIRIKCGKWWKNSLCYLIYNFLKKAVIKVWNNIDLLWIVIFAIVILTIVEIFALNVRIINPQDIELSVIFLVAEKLVVGYFIMLIILQFKRLQEGSKMLADGNLKTKIDTANMAGELRKQAENLNRISEGMAYAVEEQIKSERFKTELITNVSHDIKTPLTSIINYVDLLKKEDLQNERAEEYLEVLNRQSSKLKKLIEDLVEASKASTGNLAVNNEKFDICVFLTQTIGEFEEKLYSNNLELIINKPKEAAYVMADGRHLWRVVDNLMSNICKYAQPYSRVYIDLNIFEENVNIIFRNMSREALNVNGDELMERFVRGDRSRNTEGHGLGLSIAKSMMDLIEGDMEIVVDGDLFKVVLVLKRVE